jgi:hypothetical protein
MTKFLSLFMILLVLPLEAQLPKWNYIKEIKFPGADSTFAVPFLCTVTSNGRLYVISSSATTAGAHNAIYYADSTDTHFTLMIDYYNNGDSDTLSGNMGPLRGIAALNNDIYVSASVPYPRSKPNTVSSLYYYKDGDTNQVSKFGFYLSSAGHGTYTNGIALTKDTFAIMGVTAGAGVPGPRARFYNLTNGITPPSRGSWFAESGQFEIGGAHSAGIDVIRDVATIPGENYNDSTSVFYTSRNSQSDENITGGVASWTGGTQLPNSSPGVAKFVSQRVADFEGQLSSFSTNIPYGITVDKAKRLWVAGTDALKRWVRAYDIAGGTFATLKYELPADSSSTDPNPVGAPLRAPADVALTQDGLTAYVIDIYRRSAFQFKFGVLTSVSEERNIPSSFELLQNYPNPFNPTTFISFTLSRPGQVTLSVTNAIGQTVATLVNDHREAGRHNEVFTAGTLTSGVYFYTLTTPLGVQTKKMMLIK